MKASGFSLKCPSCGSLTTYDLENRFRPFCSERCQVADRANWADESYSIPSSTPDGEFE